MRIFGIEIKRADKGNVQQMADTPTTVVDTPEGAMPVSAGRTSIPEGHTSLTEMVQDELITPDFHIELLGALENLAKYNPDISYALDNIIQLGNTKYDIYFSDNLPDGQEEEMLAELKRVEKQWYTNSGGILSLRNDLLTQIALTGAISAERVPSQSLDGIDKVVLVNPKTVRFAYNSKEDSYDPYQESTKIIGKGAGSSLYAMNKLNTITYKYLALRKFNESPYAIPPFLAALEAAGVEKYMMDNFKTIVKKLGILGFLNVLVNQPTKTMGQSEDDYIKGVQTYLDNVAKEVEKGLSKGFVVGYKNNHTFSMEAVNSNVQGAKDLFRLNSELKMAGLKQDPLMLGRNYSTTETVGRVILAKLSAQIANYQNIMDMFLADTMYLHLLLKGYTNLQYVQIESKKPLIGDETREQEAYAKKIDNAVRLYNEGVIDQTKKAQMLGYDTPDMEEPRVPTATNPAAPIDNTPTPDPTDPKSTQYSLERVVDIIGRRLGKNVPEFDYGDCHEGGCNCEGHQSLHQFSKSKDVNEVIQKYADAVGLKYDEAVKKIGYKVTLELQKLSKGASVGSVIDSVIYNTFTAFESSFKNEIREVVKSFVEDAYVFFRQDGSVFRGLLSEIPESTFSLADFRAMEYYAANDNLYLGKFITDESTRKKIIEFIKEKHLKDGLPIGRDPDNIASFRDAFQDVLKGEDWKVTRIINTTTNKMRNTAALNYMQQAEVKKFKIIGIGDKYQCSYCAALNGRVFDVDVAVDYNKTVEAGDPAMVASASPFITSKKVDLTPESIKKMSAEEIQAKAASLIPVHGNCRCQAIAEL